MSRARTCRASFQDVLDVRRFAQRALSSRVSHSKRRKKSAYMHIHNMYRCMYMYMSMDMYMSM